MNALGIRTVIVPINDSEQAERALPYAAFLAARLDADVQLLAVAADPSQGRPLEQRLDHAATGLRGHLGDRRVAYDFWTAERIVAATVPTHAIACIATHWPTRPSIARQVVFHSDGPVLLVGPTATADPDPNGTIISAVGPSDQHLVTLTTSWSAALGVPATLLTTGDDSPLDIETAAATVIRDHGSDPITALLEHERHHPVTLITHPVPVGWARHLGRPARAASRLIRTTRAGVLAVPHP